MDNSLLNRLKEFRKVYDEALTACDPLEFANRQKILLWSIAEFMIQPLQEHEMAERSKLPKDEDEADDILNKANDEIMMWRQIFLNNQFNSQVSPDKQNYAENVFLATPVGKITNAQSYYEMCLKAYHETEPS